MKVFLETERLILRYFDEQDVSNLFQLDSDPEVIQFTASPPPEYEAIKTKLLPRFLAYYQKYEYYGFWAVIEKSTDSFIGWFHFRPALDNPDEIELGYRLQKSVWGQGYATELAKILLEKGFTEWDTQRVVASALAGNHASIRVMEKAGLKFAETFIYQPLQLEAVKYALDRADFQKSVHFTPKHEFV